jgi:hypothetical protein
MLIGYFSFTEFLVTYDDLSNMAPKAVVVCTAAWTICIGVLLQLWWAQFIGLLFC